MCCWFASSFGWFSVSWGSISLRASTTSVSMRHPRNIFPPTWSTTRPSAWNSLTKTILRSGGRMSKSTLTMWAPAISHCCKWWEHHTYSLTESISFFFRPFFPFSFTFIFCVSSCSTLKDLLLLHNPFVFCFSQYYDAYCSYSWCILARLFICPFSLFTRFFLCTSCTTGCTSVSVCHDCNL